MTRRGSNKYQRIIEAAVNIFADKGFHQTTMEEIAHQAGVGKGTLYIHFENKDHLFSSILDDGIEGLVEYVNQQLIASASPKENLKLAIRAQLEYFSMHQKFCIFLVRELWGFRLTLMDRIVRLHNRHTVIIRDILARGVEEGSFKIDDLESSATVIVGSVWAVAVHWLTFADEFPVERIYRSVIKVLFESFKE